MTGLSIPPHVQHVHAVREHLDVECREVDANVNDEAAADAILAAFLELYAGARSES